MTNRITRTTRFLWESGHQRHGLPDRSVLTGNSEGVVRRVRVDGATFERLLISNRLLERCDSPEVNQLGLLDPGSGTCYFVHECELFQLTL